MPFLRGDRSKVHHMIRTFRTEDQCFTYVRVRSLVHSRTDEGDEFVAALVNHKTAN
jgi:hypothetical protein